MEWKDKRYIAGCDPVGSESKQPWTLELWTGYVIGASHGFGLDMVNTVLGYIHRDTYDFIRSRIRRVGFDIEYSRQPKLLPQFCESLKQGDKDE